MKKLALLFFLIATHFASAQNLLTFNFDGRFVSGVGVPNAIPSNFNDAGVTSSTVGRTSLGISAFGGEAMNCNGISIGTTSPVLTSYIEFRITPQSGKQITITGVEMAQIRSNGTGATRIAVRSNLDGFTSNLGGEIDFANTTGNTFMVANLNFNLQNISSALIFRIYPYGGIQSFGTWGIGGRVGNDIIVLGTSSDIVLPINLVKFSAEKFADKAKITWTTASEFNNDKFILEKSIDAKNYEYVADLIGVGTSKELNTYKVIDDKPYKGTSYYRLTQIDFDGRSTSFSPITLSMSNGTLSIDYSAVSTAESVLNTRIYSPKNETAIYKITDINGRTVSVTSLQLTEGYQDVSISIAPLQSGVYLVQLFAGTSIVVKRIRVF